jgi:hypothetical protein
MVFRIELMEGRNPESSILENWNRKLFSNSKEQLKRQNVRKLIPSIQQLILLAFWSSG